MVWLFLIGVKVKLMPAPKGVGLCIEGQCKKLLTLAGIKDIYSKTFGQTKVKLNLLTACFKALENLSSIKIQPHHIEKLGYTEGAIKDGKEENSSNSD